MIAGGAALAILLVPPILAGLVAWVALTLLRVRTWISMIFATVLGWIAIFALPGQVGRDWLLGQLDEQIAQTIVCAIVGAGSAACLVWLFERLRHLLDRQHPRRG